MRALAVALTDLVLPGDCAGCGSPDPPWCAACAGWFGPVLSLLLPGGPSVVAVGRYSGPLRAALLRYKERGRRDLADPLAALLAVPLAELLAGSAAGPPAGGFGRPAAGPRAGRPADARAGPVSDRPSVIWLLPAPSRPSAARARGGDHVARLCRLLAAGRPQQVRVSRALVLARRARDSVGLDPAQRTANLAGRLRVRASAMPPPGAAVLLVDDVVTTGATLRACRRALGGAGVRADRALVLCDATRPAAYSEPVNISPQAAETVPPLVHSRWWR